MKGKEQFLMKFASLAGVPSSKSEKKENKYLKSILKNLDKTVAKI